MQGDFILESIIYYCKIASNVFTVLLCFLCVLGLRRHLQITLILLWVLLSMVVPSLDCFGTSTGPMED